MKKFVVLVLLVWSVFAWAQDASSVRIAQSDGQVEIRRSGATDWKPAKEGELLERGDRVAAGDKSAAVLMWSNGSMARLYPNTELVLAGVSFDLEKKMEKTILDLNKGRVFIKAQIPEHLFMEMKVRMGPLELRTQGAEFALVYDAAQQRYTASTVLGRVVADAGGELLRIDEGQHASVAAGAKASKDDVKQMDDKLKQSLAKVSKDLGGSLLADEVSAGSGGTLVAKIGGVASRRGNAPFKVNFKALVNGGSGKLKLIRWDFGDGESAMGKDAEHVFTQGLYVVILRIEDENGAKASAQTGISVEADCGC
ncbi:PKD domain-containing protein [Rhodoferax sp.]|uniref:PKD domain-containing protein n=1 Tax=Rhodoferax sp. TaxID=50421 RepID=UPI0027726C9F|nr:PKD domain-containing protein [Rhodoferax sp.]